MLLNTNTPREGNTHLFSFANTELDNLHNQIGYREAKVKKFKEAVVLKKKKKKHTMQEKNLKQKDNRYC